MGTHQADNVHLVTRYEDLWFYLYVSVLYVCGQLWGQDVLDMQWHFWNPGNWLWPQIAHWLYIRPLHYWCNVNHNVHKNYGATLTVDQHQNLNSQNLHKTHYISTIAKFLSSIGIEVFWTHIFDYMRFSQHTQNAQSKIQNFMFLEVLYPNSGPATDLVQKSSHPWELRKIWSFSVFTLHFCVLFLCHSRWILILLVKSQFHKVQKNKKTTTQFT